MHTALLLATEAGHVSPDHIAAKIAVPVGVVIFVGSVFLLLWSNYGAKKGALIYAVALFGFSAMLGVFWWFGAPGTPVATGLQNFPGQPSDAYQGQWYAFEGGSARADFFPATNNLDDFQTVAGYIGAPNASQEELERDREAAFLRGDLDQAAALMLNQYLPRDESGSLRIGAQRRQEMLTAAGDPQPGEGRADQFFTAEMTPDTATRLTTSNGTRVAMTSFTTYANFVDEDTGEVRPVPVEEEAWFAFKDPGALWFPSAVWTGISLALFILSLLALDRIEQREKRTVGAVLEAEDPAVPINQ
jgi:hypothetical protein